MGTVPLESVDESVVRKLALDRLRSSLKNGMSYKHQELPTPFRWSNHATSEAVNGALVVGWKAVETTKNSTDGDAHAIVE